MATPQNRGKQGARSTAGRFPKGVSGNPGGRPQGLGTYIRTKTQDGQAIADFMLAVMKDPARKVDHRMEAATWLADRGFGKPAQVIAHGGDGENLAPIILTWGESE